MSEGSIVIGRIAKAHGIRGEVAVQVLSEAPGRFDPGASMLLGDSSLTVEASRPHQGRMLVKFKEVADRNAAELLRGKMLSIDESELAPLAPGHFYPHQLEGLEVRSISGEKLGTFGRVLESGGHDLWEVKTDSGPVLVPAVEEFVREVDLESGHVSIDPPEGLF